MAISEPTYHPGSDGNPDNDTDPVGGSIDTETDLDVDSMIARPLLGSAEVVLRGVGYRRGVSGTLWRSARFANLAAGKPPTAAGVPRLQSTSPADGGRCWLAYQHGGQWISEGQEIQLGGLSPVNGLVTMDADTDWMLIYQLGVPEGDVSLYVNDERIGMLRGGVGGTYSCSTLFELAVAEAQGDPVACADRLTDPTGVGAFSLATWWPGGDASIVIPGEDLAGGASIGFALRARFPAGITRPWGGQLQHAVSLLGDPVEE